MSVIEIEVQGANRNLFFAPLDRVLRGELDFLKIREPQARLLADKWPTPIPGVRLRLDTKTAMGSIVDPLHDELHKATAEQIKKRFKLPPAREDFPDVHVPTWIDRMQKAVKAGHAKLVAGEFPAKLPGKPVERLLTMDAESPADLQMAILLKLAEAVDKLADKLGRADGWEE